MCGRYASTADPATLAIELDAIDETDPAELLRPEERGPNYNVAPTTKVLTVVNRRDGHDAGPVRTRIRRMRWGLIPPWTKAAEPGVPVKRKPLINARADTVATSSAFRASLARRRCLVPMDGWFEWMVEPGADGKVVKIPYYFTRADGERLYMAGLWSVWTGSSGDRPDPAPDTPPPVLSCTILTTDSIGDAARVHDRMPLIMPRADWESWLDPDHPAPEELLSPSAHIVSGLEVRRVSSAVNSVKNNGPELLGIGQ